MNSNCAHEAAIEHRTRVCPPRCVTFEIRFSICENCGHEFATANQRKKNRKRHRYAMNVYIRKNRDPYITDTPRGLW